MAGRLFTKMLSAMAAGGLAIGLICGASASASAATSTVSTQRTTETPIQTMAVFKPAATTYGPVTINCGYVTCSAYLSRSATQAAYAKETVGGGGFAAVAGAICGGLTIALPPLGIACGSIAIFQGALIQQELGEAATQHGAQGACLKVTYTRTPVPVITYWSTNNGQYCKN